MELYKHKATLAICPHAFSSSRSKQGACNRMQPQNLLAAASPFLVLNLDFEEKCKISELQGPNMKLVSHSH